MSIAIASLPGVQSLIPDTCIAALKISLISGTLVNSSGL